MRRSLLLLGLLLGSCAGIYSKAQQPSKVANLEAQKTSPVIAKQDALADPQCHPDGRFQFQNGGQFVASEGDVFSGQVGQFLICSGNTVVQYGSRIYWGDGGDNPMIVPDPFYKGVLLATHTYLKSSTYPISGHVGALCYFPNQPHGVNDLVCGSGTITVYESLPLTAFQIACDTTRPCNSVQGGSKIQVSGLITLKSPPVGLGTLVRPSVAPSGGPLSTVPYFVVQRGQNTASFQLVTSPVASATTVQIYVYSGGVTLSQTLTITP
jgi:hypothetical protein